MKTRLFATTRSFQGGATFATFDQNKFEKGVVAPIKKLLSTAPPEFVGIAVVTCGEAGSKYAEEVEVEELHPSDARRIFPHRETPTTKALCEAFPNEVRSRMLTPIICENWGLNPGSGTAINAGIEVARHRGADSVLVWSPEIDLTGDMVSEMLRHMDACALKFVGYLRENWYRRPFQYGVAQNTCAIWDMELLRLIDGMNPACNGDGKTTVSTAEFGEVPLAGMEDIEGYLRAVALLGEFVPWGNVGLQHAASWDVSRKKPGTPEFDKHHQKVARQWQVMLAYAKRIFPDREPIDVLNCMMQAATFA